MLEKSEWLTHGDELLVDSLHDALEGTDSILPVAIAPTKRPATRSGFGGIVAAGMILGVVIGVGARLLHVPTLAAPAPAIAARLSAPIIAQLAVTTPDTVDDSAGAAQPDDETARSAEDKATTSQQDKQRAHQAQRVWRNQPRFAQDIYAPYDTIEEAQRRRALLKKSVHSN